MAVAQWARGDLGSRVQFDPIAAMNSPVFRGLLSGWPGPDAEQTPLQAAAPRSRGGGPFGADPRITDLRARRGPAIGLLPPRRPEPPLTLHPARVTGRLAPTLTLLTADSASAAPPDPAEVDAMAEVRRQQAEQHERAAQAERDNIGWAAPALAPVVLALGLEAGGALGIGAIARTARGPLSFLEREIWQNPALSTAEKNALRDAARARLAQANGIESKEMLAQVHHSDPLEYAHLKPNADPNRLANLWALRSPEHEIANREWAAFRAGLRGRPPTQAEVMAAKLRIDRLIAPYVRRAGVPRSNLPPEKGGLR